MGDMILATSATAGMIMIIMKSSSSVILPGKNKMSEIQNEKRFEYGRNHHFYLELVCILGHFILSW